MMFHERNKRIFFFIKGIFVFFCLIARNVNLIKTFFRDAKHPFWMLFYILFYPSGILDKILLS
jgi:hypothetical protein